MKITKKMFKSFEGLEKLEKMQKEGYCNCWSCLKCPLKNSNINGTINGNKIECSDIIDLSLYRAKDPEIVNRMNKLIDIFTKENINSVLSELAPNRKLKYNDYVVYDNKTFKIKGVVKSKSDSLILLNGYDMDRAPTYESCIINRKAINKSYTLWVEPSEIFALNDTVIIEKDGANVEYKIVAIDESDYPILLNDHNDSFLSIREVEESDEEKDILCSIPEAYEENYSEWVPSHNIKHK